MDPERRRGFYQRIYNYQIGKLGGQVSIVADQPSGIESGVPNEIFLEVCLI